MEVIMKVAFCTNSMETVDEHFGRASQMAIYEVNDEGHNLAETRSFVPIDAEKDHKMDIAEKVDMIKDCALLYMIQIGGPATAVVVKNKIHPVKVEENTPIDGLLADLVKVLAGSPPPWLKKAMMRDK